MPVSVINAKKAYSKIMMSELLLNISKNCTEVLVNIHLVASGHIASYKPVKGQIDILSNSPDRKLIIVI